MRLMLLGVCVLAAACGGQGLDVPSSPSALVPGLGTGTAVSGERAASLPFRGSFDLTSSAAVNCPPTCPPTTLTITGRQNGNGTHLGNFTAHTIDIVNMPTTQATGTLSLTAANGDQLFATTAGAEDQFIPPNVSHVTQTATITGGTGRFAGATGTFTVEHTSTIDFAAGTAIGSGSFDGYINLNR